MPPTILRDTNKPAHAGNFRDTLQQLMRHLSRRRKRQLALLLALTLAGAAAELLSLGAVLPFIGVLSDPAAVARQPWVAQAMSALDLGVEALPLAISLVFVSLVLVALVVRLTLIWANIRFANGLGAEVGEALYERTLHRPYSFHVSRNTSQIIGSMNKVQRLIVGYVQPLLAGLSATILTLAIVGLLVAVDPAVAIGGAAMFALSYFSVAFAVRRRLRRSGRTIAVANDQRIQALQEGLGGIRDVILDRAQPIFSRRFARIEQRFRRAQASSQFISAFPRVAIEAIGILLLIAFALALTGRGQSLASMLPVLGILTVGAAKLMPLLQQIYAGWSGVASSQNSVDDVLALLDFEPIQPMALPMPFVEDIRLEHVNFRYQQDSPDILQAINLRIVRGETIGIVGPTGSGKSTLVDLLMGLLPPTTGRFTVDGITITPENAAAWQRHIAHVPQAIYLSDASIAENIAFAVDPREIDEARMTEAAKAARIHDHITSLPDRYGTMVGERGVRLSGGQRQRIGIARALYKGADVLVLDEATSALDNDTEAGVMASIATASSRLTVIMIAHRLTTMRNCDRIIQLVGGRIAGEVGYSELMGTIENAAGDDPQPGEDAR